MQYVQRIEKPQHNLETQPVPVVLLSPPQKGYFVSILELAVIIITKKRVKKNREVENHSKAQLKGYDPELEVVLCPSLDILIKHGPHLVNTLQHNEIHSC